MAASPMLKAVSARAAAEEKREEMHTAALPLTPSGSPRETKTTRAGGSPFARGVLSDFVVSQQFELLEPTNCDHLVRSLRSGSPRSSPQGRRASLSSPRCRCSPLPLSHKASCTHSPHSHAASPRLSVTPADLITFSPSGDEVIHTPAQDTSVESVTSTEYDEFGFEVVGESDDDEGPVAVPMALPRRAAAAGSAGDDAKGEIALDAWREMLAAARDSVNKSASGAAESKLTTPLRSARRHPLIDREREPAASMNLSTDSPIHSPFAATVQRPGGEKAVAADSKLEVHARLRDLVLRQGVPTELRGDVWYFLSGAAQLRRRYGGQYYQSLVSQADAVREEHEIGGENATACKDAGKPLVRTLTQIELDLNRTFVHHKRFKYAGGRGQQQLRNILSAYGIHNQTVGYCQGMSFVAAVVLMNKLEEEDAFWLFTAMLSGESLPDGTGGRLEQYYEPSMSGLLRDGDVFARLLRRLHPRLYGHLDSFGVEPLTYLTPWFMSLWTSLPCWKTVLRAWDAFFLEGQTAIFRVGLSILGRAEQHLLALDGIEELLPFLLNLPEEFVSPSLVKAEFTCGNYVSKCGGCTDAAGSCSLHKMVADTRDQCLRKVASPDRMDTPRPRTGRVTRMRRNADQPGKRPSFLKRLLVATPGIVRARRALEGTEQNPITTPRRWNALLDGASRTISDMASGKPASSGDAENSSSNCAYVSILDQVRGSDALKDFSSPRPDRPNAVASPEAIGASGPESLGSHQLSLLLGGATELASSGFGW
jgi:Rab-GTPase-TBC domain